MAKSGGVESVTLGLAWGLSQLDGDEEYLFLTLRGEDDWIRPYLGGNARTLPVSGGRSLQLARLRKSVKRHIPAARNLYRRVRADGPNPPAHPPDSDGTVERAGVDVVHFVNQAGFRTAIPSIYHPHDLQHLHLPAMFTPRQRAYRDRWYGELADQAAMVAVASSWTRNDVIARLGLPDSKVVVVPWAPPLDAVTNEASRTLEGTATVGVRLPPRFILYPAQTWPHKNHIKLIESIALLRERERMDVPLVLTGMRNAFATTVDASIAAASIGDLVTWAGFVEADELSAIYRRSTAVVIPTKFEAASGPLWEAFAAGIPAACSNVTSLPAQAGDAALLFDPDDVEQIADAIRSLWTDKPLRMKLVELGRARVKQFTWDTTARVFRAHYRRLGGGVGRWG